VTAAALAALQPGASARAAVSPVSSMPGGLPPPIAVPPLANNFPPFQSAPPNPMGPPAAATGGNPLSGAGFFVDRQSAAAKAARRYSALSVIAREPGTARFGSFSFGANGVPDIRTAVSRYLTRAAVQAPGTRPMLATYRVVDGHCGHWADPPADQAAYHNFIQGFAQGIGSYRAVLFLEMDSLITTPCLSPQGLDVRMNELNDAINVLTANCPGLVIYLDAGAADALPAHRAATLLGRAGVAKIQGFFLNSTHFDWTATEIAYGEQISRLTGGKHFVVNTGENGQGPLVPHNVAKDGNEVLCNPPGRGLGPLPTTNTGYANVDAFGWTSNPGESGGRCVPGAPPTGVYWPTYALMLVHNANFAVGKPSSARPAHRHKSHRRTATHVR
jgi:endoglucanase